MTDTRPGLRRASDGERLAALEKRDAVRDLQLQHMEASMKKLMEMNEGQSRHLSSIQAIISESKGSIRTALWLAGAVASAAVLATGLIDWALDHLPSIIK